MVRPTRRIAERTLKREAATQQQQHMLALGMHRDQRLRWVGFKRTKGPADLKRGSLKDVYKIN